MAPFMTDSSMLDAPQIQLPDVEALTVRGSTPISRQSSSDVVSGQSNINHGATSLAIAAISDQVTTAQVPSDSSPKNLSVPDPSMGPESLNRNGNNSDTAATPSTSKGPRRADEAQFRASDYERRKLASSIIRRDRLMESALPFTSLRTGLCYDVRMRYHATVDPDDVHPEDPRRIHVIYKALANAGLVEDPQALGVKNEDDILKRIPAREVSEEEAMLVHTKSHWKLIRSTEDMDMEELLHLTNSGDSIFYNKSSFLCSKLSCGGAIETCRAVWTGAVKNAIAVIRPPGHHAEPHSPMGFCLLNNVAVAAKVMQRDYPECKKILILDWDVHHGNGTQTAFYDDKSVMYMSLHRYENGTFYPPGEDGGPHDCGEGDAEGTTVNVPWASGGMCDGDYIYAFQKAIIPIAYEYKPDLIIISAGFDAAAGDMIGQCFVTPAGYAHMTHMLMSLAAGKVVVCLEGGYNLDSISASALAVTKTLMGEPPGELHSIYACPKAIEVVEEVVAIQSRYWQCMSYNSIIEQINGENSNAERLHDVIRKYQSTTLYQKYFMQNLFIHRAKLSPTYQQQVLATPGYTEKKVIVFILRDPPEILSIPDSTTHGIPLHNSFLLDSVNLYIDWAVKKGFGVVDVNIPEYVTPVQQTEIGIAKKSSTKEDVEWLADYIWDNYLELSDAEKFVFIGVGEAHIGLIQLLGLKDCLNQVAASVSFLRQSTDIRPISTVKHDNPAPWYFQHSRVHIAKNHNIWTEGKRSKLRHGNLIRSEYNTMDEMLRMELQRVTGWVEQMLV